MKLAQPITGYGRVERSGKGTPIAAALLYWLSGWRAALVGCGVWLLAALLVTPPVYFAHRQAALPWGWGEALVSELYVCGIGLVMTPLALWLGRRFPIERGHWLRGIVVHAPLAAGFAVLAALVYAYARQLPPVQPTLAAHWPFGALLGATFPLAVLVYVVAIASAYGSDYFRKYRDQERRLAQARLQALKMQLNPHFLFNTLTAISELGYTDPGTADKTITQLSSLLRSTLHSRAAHKVTLAEELAFLGKYIDIQKTLLGERLIVTFSIAPEVRAARLPNMSLQPLVENAIIHGISRRAAGGALKIKADRRGRWLWIEISDDGPGLPEHFVEDIGLGNLRARLEQLYGRDYRFDLHDLAETGVTVVLAVPFNG
jgi:hypothetical protein